MLATVSVPMPQCLSDVPHQEKEQCGAKRLYKTLQSLQSCYPVVLDLVVGWNIPNLGMILSRKKIER